MESTDGHADDGLDRADRGQRLRRKAPKNTLHRLRRRRTSRQDAADIAEAERRLSDPNERPLNYDEVRGELCGN
jgi:hypothetical protein